MSPGPGFARRTSRPIPGLAAPADRRDRRPLARPGRADRDPGVPRLASSRLGSARGHRDLVRRDRRARHVLRRVPDPRPDLPARRRRGAVVGAHPGHRRAARDRHRVARLAGRLERGQRHAGGAARARRRGVRHGPDPRPVDHARVQRSPVGPDRRPDPADAAQPDPARAGLVRDEPAQRQEPVRGGGGGADRLQPGDHRRRDPAQAVVRDLQPGDRRRGGVDLPPRDPGPAAPPDRVPLVAPDRPRRPVRPAGSPPAGPARGRARREPADVPRGDLARVDPRGGRGQRVLDRVLGVPDPDRGDRHPDRRGHAPVDVARPRPR